MQIIVDRSGEMVELFGEIANFENDQIGMKLWLSFVIAQNA